MDAFVNQSHRISESISDVKISNDSIDGLEREINP